MTSQRDATTTSTLASKIQQLDQQVADLQSVIRNQEADVEKAKAELSVAQKDLEMERDERVTIDEHLEASRLAHEKRCREYEDRLREQARNSAELMASSLQDQETVYESRLQDLDNKLRARITELNELHSSNEALSLALGQTQKQLEVTKDQYQQLQLELMRTKESLEKANADLVASYESTIASLKASGEEMQMRIMQLTNDLNNARADAQLQAEKHRLDREAVDDVHREEVATLQNSLSTLEKQMLRQEQQIQMQELKIEAANQSIAEQKRNITLLEASLSQRELMIQTRENTIQTRETTILGLEGKLAEMERTKLAVAGTMQSMQLKLDDDHAKIRELERNLERERDLKFRCEERLDECKKAYEERLEDARVQAAQRLASMEARLADKASEYDALKTRMTEEFSNRVSDLSATITSKADELHTVRRELASMTSEKNRVDELFRVYREKTEESARESALSFEATSSALVAKVKSLEEQNLELGSNLRLKTTLFEDLEQAKKQVDEELAIVTRMRQRADEKIEVQAQRIELLESAKMNLLSEIQQKNIRLESFDGVKRQLESQVSSLTTDAQKLDRSLLEKMNQIESLKKTISSHESVVEEGESRLREMEQDLFDMTRANQQQSNRILDLESAKRLVEEMLSREIEARTRLETTVAKLEAQNADLLTKQRQLEEEREKEHALLVARLDEHMAAAEGTIEGKNKEFQVLSLTVCLYPSRCTASPSVLVRIHCARNFMFVLIVRAVVCTPQELRILYEGLRKQHAVALEDRARLQAELTTSEAERDALEEEMASLTLGFENRGTLIAELEAKSALQSRLLDQRQAQIMQMDNEMQDLVGAYDQRGQKVGEYDALQNKIKATQSEVDVRTSVLSYMCFYFSLAYESNELV